MSDPTVDYAHAVKKVAQTLHEHPGPFVLVAHESPDGDALGSVLGLSRALRAMGKAVYAPMQVPRYLEFLPLPGELGEPLSAWPGGALLVVLDVDNNDPARVAGADLSTFSGPVVNIDHHGTNRRLATAGLVDPTRPAAAMLVADVVEALGLPLTEEIATPLMLGLNTDTGNFAFESVTPETFVCAAKLRAAGARLGWLNDHLRQHPHSYYALLSEVLGSMTFTHGGRVVRARVDQAMLDRAGASWEEAESFVGILRNAEGTLLALMVKDYGDRVKLSLRSRGDVSAQNVALALGGGGHVPAAGATILQPYEAVQEQIEAAITAELERAADVAHSAQQQKSIA